MSDPAQGEAARCTTCGALLPAQSRVRSCSSCLLKVALGPTEVPDGMNADAETVGGMGLEPGAVIDRYVILRKLGEGGMGVVYIAEQKGLVNRTVAIKVIKPGMDTAAVVRRFEAERRTLGLMSHPNIAQVSDAGVTSGGHPYFVMEWVDGPPLVRYCDARRLDLPARLALFLDICAAVKHAHQRGVIHCDLKPGNILVAHVEGAPVPKVIDFGVSRAVDPEARMAFTWLTMAGMGAAGTPAYMAPEQAEGEGDVDIRVDVYALGAVLYELICGSPPFGTDRLGSVSGRAGRGGRTLREIEPERPSTRVSTVSAELEEVASMRSTTREALRSKVRGELDWIILRAMEGDRERRYATVEHLAEDIGRYLRDEPVTASPPSVAYRFGKFARRHRYGLAAAAAIFLVLVLGVVVSISMAVKASRAEAKAVAERIQSERLVDFMLTALYGPLREIDRLELLEGVVDEVLVYCDGMSDTVTETDRLRLSSAYSKMAWVTDRKGEWRKAEEIARLALRIVLPIEGEIASRELRFAIAQRRADLGMIVRRFVKFDEAMELLTTAIAEMESLLAAPNLSADDRGLYQGMLAGFFHIRGSTRLMRKEYEAALGDYLRTEALRAARLEGEPASAASRNDLAEIQIDLARLEELAGKLAEAEAHAEKAVAARETIWREFPTENKWRAALADALRAYARILHIQKKLPEAYERARDASLVWRALCELQPYNATWKLALARSLHLLCTVGSDYERYSEILADARDVVALRGELLVVGERGHRATLDFLSSLARLGKVLEKTLQHEESLVVYERIERETGELLASLGDGPNEHRERLVSTLDGARRGRERVGALLGTPESEGEKSCPGMKMPGAGEKK